MIQTETETETELAAQVIVEHIEATFSGTCLACKREFPCSARRLAERVITIPSEEV